MADILLSRPLFDIQLPRCTKMPAHPPLSTLANTAVASSGTCHRYPEWHNFLVDMVYKIQLKCLFLIFTYSIKFGAIYEMWSLSVNEEYKRNNAAFSYAGIHHSKYFVHYDVHHRRLTKQKINFISDYNRMPYLSFNCFSLRNAFVKINVKQLNNLPWVFVSLHVNPRGIITILSYQAFL